MITIERLTYHYPNSENAALCDVNLTIEAGEFMLLAGPSSAGKSTLLRCINGLVPHFSGGRITGSVRVNGLDPLLKGPKALSRVVGFVTQSPESQAILDRVEPEIAFGLENAAVPPVEMRLRVEESLNLLDLTPLRDRPLSHLSGGERQRVAIAAALAFRPQVLVLDEPTSQLDPQSAQDVLNALVRLNEDLGLTIILAEHRLERVLRYADRIVYLEAGRVAIDDSVPQAALRMPQLPPVLRLARELGWTPLPLTVKEGQGFARRIELSTLSESEAESGNGASEYLPPHDSPYASSPLLSAEGLSFAYDRRPVINDVSLSINPGEAVVLMGRNGSGKTTLLKCLIGLLRPSHGKVHIAGRDTLGRDVADLCREVAYLPQNPDDLLFAESVAEELLVTLKNHGISPSRDGVKTMLDQLHLGEVGHVYPRDLSVGQRQRVALGAVGVTRPRLLLLDEPTRGLDYESKRALVDIWKAWMKQGVGLLLVTHDVELAAQIAHRVMIMSQGRIVATGLAAEVLGMSPFFAPQIARLFPGKRWLTVEDALVGLNMRDKQEAGIAPCPD